MKHLHVQTNVSLLTGTIVLKNLLSQAILCNTLTMTTLYEPIQVEFCQIITFFPPPTLTLSDKSNSCGLTRKIITSEWRIISSNSSFQRWSDRKLNIINRIKTNIYTHSWINFRHPSKKFDCCTCD